MSEPSTAAVAELARRVTGPVWTAHGPDSAGYEQERAGFDLAVPSRPMVVLGAATSADIATGMRFAVEGDLPVGLQATGHGIQRAVGGGVLITTRRLARVEVDPVARTARVEAGALNGTVIAAAAVHGLSACVGSAPAVGFVSYALGGGLGPLGRAHGWAADHVRRLEVVTADGRERTVTADQHPDLFWALRGGGGNFAAVTAMEVDLQPAPDFCGGGLFFEADRGPDLLECFAGMVADVPPELSLSIAFVTYPDLPALPAALRGRSWCQVRVAYLGAVDAVRRLIAPLQRAEPTLDTVGPLALADIGSIHADPVTPMPVRTASLALGGDGRLDRLGPFVAPGAPYLLEVRHLDGRLAQPPGTANAVGHRTARFNLFTSAYPGTDPTSTAVAQQRVCAEVTESALGGPLRNFLPRGDDVSTCYERPTLERLAALEQVWDPSRVFGFTPSLRSGDVAA